MIRLMDQDLEKAASAFVDSFELVFDNDWWHTKHSIEDSESYIKPAGTFLNPGVDDEHNDWANRGNLLDAYRKLRAVLNSRGILSQFDSQ